VENSIAAGSPFDCILLDNEMPIMRGRDAVKRTREMGYNGLVIGVTGNALEEDVEDFMRMGADDVLLKPMSCDKFLKQLRD
jgi:CheY-like chemotaxis protein